MTWETPVDEPAAASDAGALERWVSAADEGAFRAIVQRHLPRLRRIVARILDDRASRDDAVQLTLISLSRHAASIRGDLGAWLATTARNNAIDLRCSTARRHRQLDAGTACGLLMPDKAELGAELRDLLFHGLERIPKHDRELLIEHHFDGRAVEDIACAAGNAPSTVRRQLVRARTALRMQLIALGTIDTLRATLREMASTGNCLSILPFGNPLQLLPQLIRGAIAVGRHGALLLAALLRPTQMRAQPA